MDWWQAVILGFMQGITEFLPVSSSGHLILVRDLIGVNDGSYLLFDVLLHVATLFSIAVALYKDILKLFRPPFKILGFIVLASIPAMITGFLLKPLIETAFDGPKYLCFFFLATAILMFGAELIGKRMSIRAFFVQAAASIRKRFLKKNSGLESQKETNEVLSAANAAEDNINEEPPLTDLKLKNVVGMGLMQAAAIFPGLSRSGSTLFGGIATGAKRSAAAKFSFFMSVPIILGAAVLSLADIVFPKDSVSTVMFEWHYILAMITAFVVGFFAIKLMLRLIAKADYKWFSLYLLVLSLITFFRYFL